MGCSTVIFFNTFGCSLELNPTRGEEKQGYAMIIVDYRKCTGCRTCEAVCSSYNHKQQLNGELLRGLGNPYDANISVYHFNPDVAIPAVCAVCPDAPCIKACPVSPDEATGQKALYRDKKTGAIKSDPDRCFGCGRCARACRNKRTGVISLNPETRKPERMCTFCDGNPQCVAHCPYQALSFQTGSLEAKFSGMAPADIAQELIRQWYKREHLEENISGK